MKKNLILYGDSGVGKTAIANRYAFREYPVLHEKTIAINLISPSKDLMLWDTAGGERFRMAANQSTKTINVVILVFDLTNHQSFESLNEWLKKISLEHNVGTPIVLVGNKSDQEASRAVTKEEAEKYVREKNISFYIETSAYENKNLNDLFEIAKGLDPKSAVNMFSVRESSFDEDVEDDEQKASLAKITSYAETLSKLSPKAHSKNDDSMGKSKGEQLQAIFKDQKPKKKELEDILSGKQYPDLLKNRNLSGIKFYKLYSFLRGGRNHFKDNKLFESKTEELLHKYYEQTFGG